MKSSLTFLLIVACSTVAIAADRQPPTYTEHDDLSYVLTDDGKKEPIRTAKDWLRRREHILQAAQQVMGPLPKPASPVELEMEVIEETDLGHSIRRKVSYHTDSNTARVRAWLIIPKMATAEHPAPAALCLHQTTPMGKDEPAGLGERNLQYALELAQHGYVTLAPDYPSFGEYPYDFEQDRYESGTMKAIYDNVRAIDLLQSLPEVDDDAIGAIGHSLGGHNAIFTAIFEPRIKAVVSSCGFTSFANYFHGDLTGWSSPRYMPRIATHYHKNPAEMPFDFTELVAAIAPRAFYAVAPLRDDNFDVEGVRRAMTAAKPVYRLLNRQQNLEVEYPDAAHTFPPESRERAYQFLDRQLMPNQREQDADGVRPITAPR